MVTSISAITNKQIVVDAYNALAQGDPSVYVNALSEDVRHTFFGNHRFGRTFQGKDDLYKNLFGPMREVLQGTVKMHVKNAIAEGDQVVVEVQGEARTKDGRDYNNSYCIVLKIRGGKIVEIREYLDTELVKTLFG